MTSDEPIRFRTLADDDTWAKVGPSGREQAEPREFAPASASPRRGRAVLAWGTGLALVAGVAIAVAFLPRHSALAGDNGASGGALHVDRYVNQPKPLTSTALLPCYVDGSSIGAVSLTDCARRNGVASGRLDVGLTPPPKAPAAAPPPQPSADALEAMPNRPYAASAPMRSPLAARPDSNGEAVDPAESVGVAQTFYESLADGDGVRAASVVVPEKRREGPLSAGALSRFYSDLDEPLRLTRLYPLDDHTVVARYAFVTRDGAECQGTARVTTTERDGETYIQGIRALNGC